MASAGLANPYNFPLMRLPNELKLHVIRQVLESCYAASPPAPVIPNPNLLIEPRPSDYAPTDEQMSALHNLLNLSTINKTFHNLCGRAIFQASQHIHKNKIIAVALERDDLPILVGLMEMAGPVAWKAILVAPIVGTMATVAKYGEGFTVAANGPNRWSFPLHYAMERRKVNVIPHLLQHGAPGIARLGQPECCFETLDRGWGFQERLLPLHFAVSSGLLAYNGDEQLIKYFEAIGAPFQTIAGIKSHTILTDCLCRGNLPVARVLVNASNPFHMQLVHNHRTTMLGLCTGPKEVPLLFLAVALYQPEFVRFLVHEFRVEAFGVVEFEHSKPVVPQEPKSRMVMALEVACWATQCHRLNQNFPQQRFAKIPGKYKRDYETVTSWAVDLNLRIHNTIVVFLVHPEARQHLLVKNNMFLFTCIQGLIHSHLKSITQGLNFGMTVDAILDFAGNELSEKYAKQPSLQPQNPVAGVPAAISPVVFEMPFVPLLKDALVAYDFPIFCSLAAYVAKRRFKTTILEFLGGDICRTIAQLPWTQITNLPTQPLNDERWMFPWDAFPGLEQFMEKPQSQGTAPGLVKLNRQYSFELAIEMIRVIYFYFSPWIPTTMTRGKYPAGTFLACLQEEKTRVESWVPVPGLANGNLIGVTNPIYAYSKWRRKGIKAILQDFILNWKRTPGPYTLLPKGRGSD